VSFGASSARDRALRSASECVGVGMLVDGRMKTVVVRREDRDAANQPGQGDRLVSAVVDYVNEIQRSGVYARHELLAVLMQAYHADYYLAQVNNGGHSQFIRNTGAMLPTTGADALAGLGAMGARAQHQILAEMMAWVKANPEEAAAQNGFSVRAPLLDQLDKGFYEAERQTPMHELSAKWIAGWPELRVVAVDQYAGEIERLAQLNPHLEARRIWHSVRQLGFQMSDKLQITIAAACGAVKPEGEFKLAVRPGSQMDVEGRQCMVFGVQTNLGARLCVFEEAGGRLYQFVKRSPPPKEAPPEERTKYQPLVVGARLSNVDADMIRRFEQIADQTLAAAAIDLILRKLSLNPVAMITAFRVIGVRAAWYAVTGKACLMIVTSPDRADVVESGGEPTLTVTRAEIERHASLATTGSNSMRPPA
jgi:Domain of unknown function (DUF4375)